MCGNRRERVAQVQEREPTKSAGTDARAHKRPTISWTAEPLRGTMLSSNESETQKRTDRRSHDEQHHDPLNCSA
jgi:hypothetical protein